MVYRRSNSKYWWYKFNMNGHTIRESTEQGNRRTAELMEAARRVELARAKALGLGNGINANNAAKTVPLLKEFAERFKDAIATDCSDKPDTISFYNAKLRYLLADEILANCRLDEIDESVIDQYKQRRTKTISNRKKPMSVASVNLELKTLRRLLGIAQDYKVVAGLPRVRRLRGEHEREFVLSFEQERDYLNAAAAVSTDLHDIAVLAIDTGLRMGEVLKLATSDVRLIPADGAQYGYLTVRSRNSKNSKSRNVPLNARVSEMLTGRMTDGLVFMPNDAKQRNVQIRLNRQHRIVRDRLQLTAEFVPHSFRHTYGTRLGESGADAFTIMNLMGHSKVTVSQKYVHPSPETVERAVHRMETMSERKRTEAATRAPGSY